MYYGHLGTGQKSPDYQGVLIFQVILYYKVQFGTSFMHLDYAGIFIHINRLHYKLFNSSTKLFQAIIVNTTL